MKLRERLVGSDVLQRARQRLGPWIDRLARMLGQPVYEVRPEGYVGAVDLPIDEFEARLLAGGFSWDPISLYHYTPEDNAADGSWVYRESLLADRQLHVVLVDQFPDHVDVYAHDEPSWIRHPVAHASQDDIRPSQGSAELRRWLDRQDIECDHDSLIRRTAEHVLTRFLRSPRRP